MKIALLLALPSILFVIFRISAFALSSDESYAQSAHASSPELETKVEASAKL